MMRIIKKVLFVFCLCVLLNAQEAVAYDQGFAHRQLANQTYNFWQKTVTTEFGQTEKNWLVNGSINEDSPAYRTVNHFYEPTSNRGLIMFGVPIGYPITDWAGKSGLQHDLWGGDYSWPTGVKALQNKKDNLAWTALGHNLHLLADMASPAHVHNDSHAEGDNYEIYIKYLLSNDKAINQLADLQGQVICSSLETCLKSMAVYTHRRALSKDWVDTKNLPAGTILASDGNYYLDNKLIGKYDLLTEKVILDSEVYEAYWQDLAPIIISYGQSLINNYLREAGLELSTGEIAEGIKIVAPVENKKSLPDKIIKKITAPQKTETIAEVINNLVNKVFKEADWVWPEIGVVDESINIPVQYLVELWFPPVSSGGGSATEISPGDDAGAGDSGQPVDDNPGDGATSTDPGTGGGSGGGSGSGGGGSGAGGADNPATTTLPAISFVNLPSIYNKNINIAWQAEPAGEWVYDLKIKYDDREQQNLLTESSVKEYMLTASEWHKNLELTVTGRLPDGSSTSTSALINFQPQWPTNLFAYWSFDECSGDSAFEVIAQNNLPIRSSFVSGKSGCALRQNGTGPQSTGRNLKEPIADEEFTISYFWRDATDWPVGYAFNTLALADAQTNRIIGLAPSIDMIYFWYDNVEIPLEIKLPLDHNWHHVAGVFSHSAFKFYLDGQLAKEVTGDYSLLTPITKFYLYGEISIAEFDEMTWWKGELSAGEISRLASGGRVWE